MEQISGGTYYDKAFQVTENIFKKESYFLGNTNRRIIIFMTDGAPHNSGESILKGLKNDYGVSGLYSIFYGGDLYDNDHKEARNLLEKFENLFSPNSDILMSNASNLTETFKEILY